MSKRLFAICVLLIVVLYLPGQQTNYLFRVRTITAGVTLNDLADTSTFISAIQFLKKAKQQYSANGYEVQTLRISTQNFYLYLGQHSYDESLKFLVRFDQLAQRNGVIFAIGQVLPPDQYQTGIAHWAEQLIQTTKTASFSLSIASHEKGICFNSIKAAAEIIAALSRLDGGEANFRFTASANCPAGIPFFPAAFHEGSNSFAIGLESANLVRQGLKNVDAMHARQALTSILGENLQPVQMLAENISKELQWTYDGIDVSPAPGLDASIGQAIETFTQKPFGDPATLAACALITDVLKTLDLKKCGYSGLMLPVIEDKVLAQRAMENRFTVQELLLYSSVSGTGLDVVPLPGDTPKKILENILGDVAALSLKYTSKALSARLFLIPGKKAGDIVKFKNPHLTPAKVMKPE